MRALLRRFDPASGAASLSDKLLIAAIAVIGVVLIWSAATVQLTPVQQAGFAAATIIAFLVCNRHPGRPMTLFLVVLSAAVSLRYIIWRVTETLEFNTWVQAVLGSGLALAELYAVIVLALGYVQTSWPLERKPMPLPEDPDTWPTVDVYIPTYNEDLSVVRATVLAALGMDWPPEKLRVYILDDGRRTQFRDFAEACGAGYIIRPDNQHAKAGNLNHALGQTDGEFIAVFDCDHIPTRAFLQMTLGWMVHDPRLGALQTPHHFYSPDPFQRNLTAGTRVPSEGNMFYGLVQDGNDFWNAAFFCGSCAVIRRRALQEIGGFAVETVTEDAHTALRLHRAGWNSAYLRLPLAAGLATERLILHIGQRIRWARGMLQIMRLDNPLFGRGLSLGQRLCYTNAMAHFLFAIPRLVFLTSPLAFLLFGQNIIAASPLAIVAYALPHVFHAIGTNARIQRNWRHSFWSEIYETVLALFLVRVTLATLISPRRGKFNVTSKGGLLNNGYFDMRAVYPNLILAGLLLVGLLVGLYGLFFQHNDTLRFQALLLNSIWVTFSLLIVMGALAVGRETRQVRTRHRIRARLPAVLWLPDGRTLQGTSRDLSLGGASLVVPRPDDVADAAQIDIELSTGGERLFVPAQAQRWTGNALQLSWQPRSIADESRIVRAVFGRADAWVGWSDYPRDRPLRSLWYVLVSIRGLFRARDRMIAVPDRAAEADVKPSAAGTLAKKTYVLRPRSTVTSRAAVAALLFLIPALARAQNMPPAGSSSGPGMTVRPIPAPVPHLPTASEPSPQSPPPLPAPAGASREPAPQPGPAAGIETRTRQIVYTLRDLGAAGPMTMRGTSAIQGVLFGVRSDEVVTSAELRLSGAMSPSLLPQFSNVTVTLNEQYVGSIPVNPEQPEFGPLAMPVNPVFFQDRNRLNFRFTGRYAADCNDPLSGLLWSTISDTSTLTLTLAKLPARRDLARLPRPFFDDQVRRTLVLPFVLQANPSNEALQAAAILASWFGKLADFRGARFPVTAEALPEGNAVMVITGHDAPAGIVLPPISGPTVAEIPNPSDPYGTILVIAGRTGAETVAAASTLALGSRTLSGASALVQAPSVSPRKPYDAPDWIPTDRPVKFGELVDASELQGTGYVPGTFHVPFHTAPDLYTWRGRPFSADIRFRAPPGPIVDVAASRLDVSINGLYLRSYSLAPADRPLAWLSGMLGFATSPTHGGVTSIPPYTVFGENDLQLFFDARPLHRGDCAAIPQDLHMSVDPDSTIDLSRAYHFTALPNIAFFVGSGFPFTRLADLSETAAILPAQPDAAELSAFLELMGHLGARTDYPALRLAVVRPSEVQRVADRDLLLIGRLRHLAGAADLLRGSPFELGSDRLQVRLPTPLDNIWRLFGDRTADQRQRASAALSTPLGDEGAALVSAASPFGHGRSLVALVAQTGQGLDAMVAAMRDRKLVPAMQGDLSLLAGGTVTSYRVGSTYTVGHLPFWLWPDWLLRDHPAEILGLMILACAMLTAALFWALRRRAARRLSRRAGTG